MLLSHRFALASVTAIAAATFIAACAGDEENRDSTGGVLTPVPSGRRQSGDDPATTTIPADASNCEALGALFGTGLEASLDSATRRSVAVPLASRPTPTRVSVQGVGAAGELSGKTIALGVALNASYDTCTHCLLITVDGATYFPRSGSATFTSVAAAPGQAFGGRFRDVILDRVTVDPATGATSVVPDARCLFVRDLAFEAVVPATQAASNGGGAPDGSIAPADSGSQTDGGDGDDGTGSSGGLGGGGGHGGDSSI